MTLDVGPKQLKGTPIRTFATARAAAGSTPADELISAATLTSQGGRNTMDASSLSSKFNRIYKFDPSLKETFEDETTKTTFEVYNVDEGQVPQRRSRKQALLDMLNNLDISPSEDDFVYDVYQVNSDVKITDEVLTSHGITKTDQIARLLLEEEIGKSQQLLQEDSEDSDYYNNELDDDSNDEDYYANEYPDEYDESFNSDYSNREEDDWQYF